MEVINEQKSNEPSINTTIMAHWVTLLNNFYISVHQMSKHLFHYKWQGMQYEELKTSFQHGEVMAISNFGQNINHKKQREAQGGHFNRWQSPIFPFVCNYLCRKCSTLVMHKNCLHLR